MDQSAYVKAAFLSDITLEILLVHISKTEAVEILGTMLGGYNIAPLIKCLQIDELGDAASSALVHPLILMHLMKYMTFQN